MIGSAHNDTLVGSTGNNTLQRDGDDVLEGGSGSDRLGGGTGTTARYTGSSAAKVDLRIRMAQSTGGYGSDMLIGITNLEGGSGADCSSAMRLQQARRRQRQRHADRRRRQRHARWRFRRGYGRVLGRSGGIQDHAQRGRDRDRRASVGKFGRRHRHAQGHPPGQVCGPNHRPDQPRRDQHLPVEHQRLREHGGGRQRGRSLQQRSR